jgi:peptide-methionine (S)-S-oxide reductase
VGTQYRSVIFYHSPEQRATAEAAIAELDAEHVWDDKIVTQLVDAPDYYPAETYHQDYYAQNPDQGYCQVVIAPKVAKFRKKYLDRLMK